MFSATDEITPLKIGFHKDQKANIQCHFWKERLKTWKLTKFTDNTSKASEVIIPQSREIFENKICMMGRHELAPHHTKVCKFGRLCEATSSLVFKKSFQTW